MRKIISLAIVMLFAMTAMAANDFEYVLLSGNSEQTVNAGEKIQAIQFKVRYAQEVGPLLLNGLDLQCSEVHSFSEWSTCEISGRVASFVPSGVYDMEVEFIDANNNTKTKVFKTTVVGMKSDIELLSGSVDQTITAGDAIEPIVYRYRNLDKVFLNGAPAGVNIDIDDETYTFTISGTTKTSSSNRTFKYTIKATIKDSDTSAIDTAYAHGTFTLNKTPGVLPCEVIENETQSVKPGEKIKPIVVKLSHGVEGLDILSDGVSPESFSVEQDNSAGTITFTNAVPENYLDGSIKLRVVALMSDGSTDTALAVINVVGNINYTKMQILENDSQVVAPGDSIKPVVLQYLNAKKVNIPSAITGLSAKTDKTLQTITIMGKIPENVRDTCYKFMAYAVGEEKNDTAYVIINIVHKPAVTSVVLVSDEDTQTVKAGDSIKPFVFEFENALSVVASGFPKNASFSIKTDKENNRSVLSGVVSDSAASGRYNIKFIAEGLDNNDTAFVTLLVMNTPVLTLIGDNDKQTVVSGDSIEPIVFKYANVTGARAKGLPTGITMTADAEAKTLTIHGKIDASNFYGDYDVTVEADCYELHASELVTISIVAPKSSSSSVSSSSSAESSSSVVSSSSEEQKTSSSSVASSSSVSSSSSAKSSSSATPASSSSSVTESSSSSVVVSSSSTENSSSSSEKVENSSSSAGKDAFVAQRMNSLKLSVEGRVLHVGGAEWANVDVFDMQGRPVASFKQAKGAIALDMLQQGNYIVRVRSGSNSLTRKIAIK